MNKVLYPFKGVYLEVLYFIDFIISFFPGLSGIFLRRLYCRVKFQTGKGLNISIGTFLSKGHGLIIIGNNVAVNKYVAISADPDGKIEIGDNVLIGKGCVLRACNHRYDLDIPINQQGWVTGSIKIGNNVWLGSNVVITPDVVIGDNCIIGANAVVTHNIESNSIAGGIPAKIIAKMGK